MCESRELKEAIRFFTWESRIMDGLCVIAGRGKDMICACDGAEIGPKTLYDLASLTKILTGLCCMRLREMGKMNFSARIPEYDPRFRRLSTVTVEQLMGFQLQIQTAGRVDARGSREEALECLFGSEAVDIAPEGTAQGAHHTPGHRIRRFYSDIPAMILKYMIEGAAGMPYYDCLRKLILEPAGMEETWACVPEGRRGDCLSYGPEYRIEGEKRICRESAGRGIPHDPKAALLQGNTGDLCGHAGLFATAGDMVRLCRAILEGKIVSAESLREMAVNRTGRQLADGTWTQYLGYQCYIRHPDQYFSEIPASMSSSAFGIGGFTGNHMSVDPATDRFTLFLGNRVRNRLTVAVPEAGKTLTDYGLNPDGTGCIRWTDGSEHFSSVNYVHQKDARLHAVIDREFGLA